MRARAESEEVQGAGVGGEDGRDGRSGAQRAEAADGIYQLVTVVLLIMYALMYALMRVYPFGKRRMPKCAKRRAGRGTRRDR